VEYKEGVSCTDTKQSLFTFGAMLKSKQHGTDWSSTGTFLRKPAGGWIHEDGEFHSGLSINYTVQVRRDKGIVNSTILCLVLSVFTSNSNRTHKNRVFSSNVFVEANVFFVSPF